MPDILFGLGAAVVKAACKIWLKDHTFAADVTASTADLITAKVSGMRERRQVRRLFEDLEETVADKVEGVLANEFGGLAENERNAAVLAVADSFDHARLVDKDLFTADLDPLYLERQVRRSAPHAVRDLGRVAAGLYDRVLSECCTYVIELARELPAFDAGAFTEILRRQTQILEAVRELLVHTPQSDVSDPDGSFTAAYRRHVAGVLDRLELYGVTAADTVRRYPLSLAYISLTTRGADLGLVMAEPTGDLRPGPASLRIDDVLDRSRWFFLRGQAGSGKTTVLQWLAVRSARGDFTGRLAELNGSVPFFIPLRRYVGREPPAPEQFLRQVGRHIADEMPAGWVHRQLREGRALVLVDGIDEMPEEERSTARGWLCQLTEAFPHSRFVVTSRPAAADEDWLAEEGFDSAELEPMSWADIKEFVHRWFSAICGSRADAEERTRLESYEPSLLEAIRSRRHLRALAANPLLCALLCALHLDRHMSWPRDRMELYAVALQMLLERRDVERRVSDDGLTLSYTEKTLVLQDLAYWLIRNGLSDAPMHRAIERVGQRLGSLHHLSATAEEVFRHLLIRSGLLREPIAGRVDYIHRTFQEFLAAQAAVEADDVGALVQNACRDQWREVVVMAAGHAQPRQRRELLEGLLDRADRQPQHRRELHVLAVACLETSQLLEPDLQKRIQAVAAALLPPRRMSDAEAIARAGESVLDLLTARPPRTAQEAAASIRTASTVGGDAALKIIARCGQFKGRRVEDELRSSWRRFDADAYAQEVLANSSNLTHLAVSSPDQLRAVHHLTKLEALFYRTTHGDLEFVRRLPMLRTLLVNDPALIDLAALTDHPGLRELFLEGTGPVEIDPLSTINGLERVLLRPSNVRDIGPLADCRALTMAGFEGVLPEIPLATALPSQRLTAFQAWYCENLTSLVPLAQTPQLAELSKLWLASVPLENLAELGVWANTLTELTLWGPRAGAALASIPELPRLEFLGADWDGQDLAPLRRLPALHRLILESNTILDLSPLRDLAELGDLELRGAPKCDLRPFAGRKGLTIEVGRRTVVIGASRLGPDSRVVRRR